MGSPVPFSETLNFKPEMVILMKNRRNIILLIAVVLSALTYALASETFGSDQSWLGSLLTEDDEDVVVEDFLLEDSLWANESESGESAAADPLPVQLSPWSLESSVGGGLGYRENVLFGVESKQVDSSFQQIDFDAFAMRSFAEGRGDFATVFFGELRRYDSVPGLSSEHLMAMNTRIGMEFLSEYRGVLQIEAMHSKQAIDASVDDFETEALAVSVFRPGVELALERAFEGIGRFTLSTGYRKSQYSEDSEDFAARSYGLEWEKRLSDRSRLTLGWERYAEDYDRKRARRVGEAWEDAPLLELSGNRYELEWLWTNREGTLRRSRFTADYEKEQDRFGDYYARSKMRIRQGLEWQFGRWELDTGVSMDQLDYDKRATSSDPETLRSDDSWRWDVELSREIGEDWQAFVRHENSFKDSSDAIYEYDAASTYIGLNWNFLSK